MKKLIVNSQNNNKKLVSFILTSFPYLNKNVLFKALRKKDIKINNARISKDIIIHTGDEIKIYITDEYFKEKNLLNINTIFEDDNILVVDKPENLCVTSNSKENINLTSILQKKYSNNIFPCHRIDRNTKGLVLFAKNENSYNILLKKLSIYFLR